MDDADERPTKLRKLDHDSDSNLAPEPSSPTSAPPTITALPLSPSQRPNLKDPALRALAQANPGLSKNALKKLLRQRAWEATAPARKAKRKAEVVRRREAKRTKRAALLASGVDSAEAVAAQYKGGVRAQRTVQLPITFVVDCGFDGLMSDGERTSLGAQVTRAYSDNKHARWRGHLVVASWGGRLRERFEGVLRGHYKGWKGVRFEEKDVAKVADMAREWMRAEEGGRLRGPFDRYLGLDDGGNGEEGSEGKEGGENGEGGEVLAMQSKKQLMKKREEEITLGLQAQGEVVYLTSESPDTLTELKPYSTYIVGGLVDKNREKGICYKRAKEAGIKTARLPIGDYLQMASRKVLATNHVVEIMLKWLEYEDLGKAFLEVIPKRKGGQLKGQGGKGGDEQADSEPEVKADDDIDNADPDLDDRDDGQLSEDEVDDSAGVANSRIVDSTA